jgi:hypothetical protein
LRHFLKAFTRRTARSATGIEVIARTLPSGRTYAALAVPK